jgi:hypothetical protein
MAGWVLHIVCGAMNHSSKSNEKEGIMNKRLLILFLLVVLLTVPASAQDEWPLTESVDITGLDFPFSMDYPAGWFAEEARFEIQRRNGTAITEFEEDLQEVFDGTFQIQGYAIVIDVLGTRRPLVSNGLPTADPSLEDLAAAFVQMYGYQEPTEISETAVLGQVPALSLRTVDGTGNAVMAVVGFGEGGKTFLFSLAAPSEETLDAFVSHLGGYVGEHPTGTGRISGAHRRISGRTRCISHD